LLECTAKECPRWGKGVAIKAAPLDPVEGDTMKECTLDGNSPGHGDGAAKDCARAGRLETNLAAMCFGVGAARTGRGLAPSGMLAKGGGLIGVPDIEVLATVPAKNEECRGGNRASCVPASAAAGNTALATGCCACCGCG